jgi:hypothetical protein
MDPGAVEAAAFSHLQAVAAASLMVSATHAFAPAKLSPLHMVRLVQPVRSHRRAEGHLHREVEAAAVCRVRVSRVADPEEATAADAQRNRGKIPGCMEH